MATFEVKWLRQLFDFVRLSGSGRKVVLFDWATKKGVLADSAPAADSVPWSGVAQKPDTFPPDPHTHSVAAIPDIMTIGQRLVVNVSTPEEEDVAFENGAKMVVRVDQI